jgi:4-diphosphocytidyl-2-C-methyl-D-erythritol kinase
LPPRERFERVDGILRVAAPAKINLDLYVGPRRADGYHPVDSVVAKVTLYDDLLLRGRLDGEITLRVDGADCGPLERNLALRAAHRLAEETDTPFGADIHLTKAIPPGRGLGGGSSDAAAVLAGLARMWRVKLPAERVAELAAELGSDVPLFLGSPAARITGRGERLQPVAIHPFVALLHVPDIACSTRDVYRRFDELPPPIRSADQRDLRAMGRRPPSRWRRGLHNDLAPAACAVGKEFAGLFERLRECLGGDLAMTGSGSAMFVLCDDEEEAARMERRLPNGLPGRTVLVRLSP